MQETKKRKRGNRGKEDSNRQCSENENEKLKSDAASILLADKANIREIPKIEFRAASTENQGETLDIGSRTYFREIEKSLHDAQEEDLALLVENVFEEVNGKEIDMICDFEGSRILEKLLAHATDFQIRVFCDRLNGCFYEMFTNSFASHVCQTLLKLGADLVVREITGVSIVKKDIAPELSSMQELILGIADELQKYWPEFVTHQHGSHVLRTLINVLSGTCLQDEKANRSKRSKKYNEHHQTFSQLFKQKTRVIPSNFELKLKDIVASISDHIISNDLTYLITHNVANPVLQMLVGVEKIGQDLITKILAEFSVDQVHSVLFKDTVGSHLMERIINHASVDQLRIIYKDYLKENLLDLCRDDKANFVVQSYIQNIQSEKHYKKVLKALVGSVGNFLFGFPNRTGIVVKLVNTAARLKLEQQTIFNSIFDSFEFENAGADVNFASCILNLKRASVPDAAYLEFKPKLPGSLLIQGILGLENSLIQVVINSIASLKPDDVLRWAKDSVASRILDSYLERATIPNAAQRNLIEAGFGHLAELACDGTGSHFVEHCWKAANLATKERIATELSSQKHKLASNHFGKYLLRNFNIDLFNKRKDDWMEIYKKKKGKKVNVSNEIDDLFAKAGK